MFSSGEGYCGFSHDKWFLTRHAPFAQAPPGDHTDTQGTHDDVTTSDAVANIK